MPLFKSKTKNNFQLDRLFLRRLKLLLGVMFPRCCSPSIPLTIYVLLISALDQVVTYFVGILPSEFYVVLGNKDIKDFRRVVFKSVAVIVGKCLTLTGIKFSSSIIYIHWRRTLTLKLHRLYFHNFSYYFANTPQCSIDNPDQRITQDVDRFCLTCAEIFAKLIMSPFIIAYYTYKTYIGSGWLGPVAIFVYFIVGTVVNKLIMSPIVGIIVKRERMEGDFRFKHVSVRSNAESIGFYKAGIIENYLSNVKLDRLLATQQKLVNFQFPLNFSMSTFDYFGSILSYLIVAIPIFVWHSYDDMQSVDLVGIISQNSFFYMYLINSFSTLVDMSSKISEIAGTTHRVGELLEYLQMSSKHEDELESCESGYSVADSPKPSLPEGIIFSLNMISFKAPDSEAFLIKDLSIELALKNHVLITGDSGTGKTALFRILRGLWPHDLGSYQSCVDVLFLPQRAYCTNGSLHQQVLYPVHASLRQNSVKQDDENITHLLNFLKLDHLIERCGGLGANVDWDWNESLSPGECQRLSMARVLFHKPKLVFLDEVTSAVGIDLEEQFYVACQKVGITYVSIGHRESLKLYHKRHLHLEGDGRWTLTELAS